MPEEISMPDKLIGIAAFLTPILEDDPFVESEYYPGDLLLAVLNIERSFWRDHVELYQEVYMLT